MTDEQIKKLLDWFVNESGTRKKWSERRQKALDENHRWIQPEVIQQMVDEELEKKFLDYYNTGTGEKQRLNAVYRDRIIRDKALFRQTIGYLLDESIEIKERINQVLEGSHKIPGFGKAIVTAFLMDYNPDKYCLWNNKTEMGFDVLGWRIYETKDSLGDAYSKVLSALKNLRNLNPENQLTFLDIDLFLHTIAAEEEGKHFIYKMMGVSTPAAAEGKINYWQIAPGEKARLWDELRNGSIAAVGYSELDFDLSDLTIKSREEAFALYAEHNPRASVRSNKIQFTQLWNFLHLNPGDRFVTNNGRSLLLALGVVKGRYKFKPERQEYRHTVDVDYYKVSEKGIPIPNKFKGIFGKTIVPLSKSKFEALASLFDLDDKNVLIFQANPAIYDVRNAILELEDILWRVKTYRDKIKPGDRAYIWQSGPEAGILAIAAVTTAPKYLEDDGRDSKFHLNENALKEEKEEWRVNLHIEKVLENPIPRVRFVEHSILSECTIIKAPQGTNFLLKPEEAKALEDILGGITPGISEIPPPSPTYTTEDFVSDTGFKRDVIESWQRRIRRKMHIVFQGPPGTGKTYVAERLARLLVSGTKGFWEVVQFHPSYAYEDFIQGIRPRILKGSITYELEKGRFLEFCRKAQEVPDESPCVLIIDEMNRAHLSRVFGELMYLLEYRDKEIPLAAGGAMFRIPQNVYIIGTMNTADRSIALVDHALRRRFSFIRLDPNYEILTNHLKSRGYPSDSLVLTLKEINRAIDDPNFEIGISYFMRKDQVLKEHLSDIWLGEIEPYLEEFFYDQLAKVEPFRWRTLIENKLKDWA
jgi:MoxR-like ATPase